MHQPDRQHILFILGALLISSIACQVTVDFSNDDGDGGSTITPADRITPTANREVTFPENSTFSVNIYEWSMGPEFDLNEFAIVNPTSVFTDEEDIYILMWMNIDSMSEIPYRAEWMDPHGIMFLKEEGTASPGQTGWYLSANPNPGGWSSGAYTVRLYFEDQLTTTFTFSIEE
jgi:hypothetical protein